MKFSVQAKDLKKALGVASLVKPAISTNKNESGYLFVVEDGRCSIHSRNEEMRVRVHVPITDVDGEGSFAYPADKVDSVKYISGKITFEAGQEGDRFWLRYQSTGGAKSNRSTFDPELIQPVDTDLEDVPDGYQVNAALLKESLLISRSCIDEKDTDSSFSTIQIFDAAARKEWAKGDGCMFSSDRTLISYFNCDAFKGKGLAIHFRHVGGLTSFLGKCKGDVTVRTGEAATFVVDSEGGIFGWPRHTKYHGKYSYYPLKMDKFVLSMPKEYLVQSLQYLRSELSGNNDKIRVDYDPNLKSLQFKATEAVGAFESEPVKVTPVVDEETGIGKEALTESFSGNVNLNHMLKLVDDKFRGREVQLRVATIEKNGRSYLLLRTIDQFTLDEDGRTLIDKNDKEVKGEKFLCEVTRFMPSKD